MHISQSGNINKLLCAQVTNGLAIHGRCPDNNARSNKCNQSCNDFLLCVCVTLAPIEGAPPKPTMASEKPWGARLVHVTCICLNLFCNNADDATVLVDGWITTT